MKRIVLLLNVVAIALLFNVTNVAAKDYYLEKFDETTLQAFLATHSEDVTSGKITFENNSDSKTFTITLNGSDNDALRVIDQSFIGTDDTYFLNMSSDAEILITLEIANSLTTGEIAIEIKSGDVVATVPQDANEDVFYTRKFISGGVDENDPDDDINFPINFLIDENATLTFDCEVIVTSTTQDGVATDNANGATITNNGVVNYNGAVTIENGAILNGSGTNNVLGTIEFLDNAESNLDTVLTLASSNASIVASNNISNKVVSLDGNVVYDESTGSYKVSNENTPVETPSEEVENPSTNDDVATYILIGVVAVLGIAGTIIYLKKAN